jgi:hypothetical protein
MSPFEKVTHTDRSIYGPRKLILCGFSQQAQSKFKTLLDMIGIANLPLVWVGSDQLDQSIEKILSLPDDSGSDKVTGEDRAIVVAGIAEKELHQLMSGCRQAGMRGALWAALTPTSVQWTMSQLIAELKAERAAMAKRKGKA